MGVLGQIRSHAVVLKTARRNRLDLLQWLRHRPQVLSAIGGYEMALMTSASVDSRLKALAGLKAAALVNCEFCLDIGSAISRVQGLSERQQRELPSFRTSDAFDDTEKLVLEFAEAMTRTPAHVGDELRQRLLERFSPTQLTELAAEVAWENHRARLNQALGVRPAGFSEGGFCALPERPEPTRVTAAS